MKILLIEGYDLIAAPLKVGLSEAGYVVDHAADGLEGLLRVMSKTYDAIIIDRVLPDTDALALVQRMRSGGDETPVLILGTLDKVYARIECLEAGGDAYLVKTVALSELLAVIRALIRCKISHDRPAISIINDFEPDLDGIAPEL